MTTPREKIQKALDALSAAIEGEGYRIEDFDLEAMPEEAVELYRYPPEEYDQVICAVPARTED